MHIAASGHLPTDPLHRLHPVDRQKMPATAVLLDGPTASALG